MALKIDAENEKQVCLFDKNTGEKFTRVSGIMINDISHFHLKSEVSGKTVLLSEYGIQRRFSETPDGGKGRAKGLVPSFLKLI